MWISQMLSSHLYANLPDVILSSVCEATRCYPLICMWIPQMLSSHLYANLPDVILSSVCESNRCYPLICMWISQMLSSHLYVNLPDVILSSVCESTRCYPLICMWIYQMLSCIEDSVCIFPLCAYCVSNLYLVDLIYLTVVRGRQEMKFNPELH